MSCTVLIACAHDCEAPGIVTFGQLDVNPICVVVTSALPPHMRSAPPHALQMLARFFESAFAIAGCALPASGHGPEIVFLSTASSHFWSALLLATRNLVVDVPIER